jgi:pyrroline-5-carboxylate reductase|tara:strand:+ start:3011 stop:3778 length:768 start_codon:yes stop_codon:yes gene_type:complete
MKIGFIGTGHITKSVINGILGSKLKIKKILISKRSNKISTALKKKSKKIAILNDNQEIINKSNWVFLAVTPEVGHKILPKLKFKKNQTIISFISTIKMRDLKNYVKVNSKIVRAIPLPPISIRKGPVPIFPPNKKVKQFFDYLGTTVEINKENLSLNFWSTSSMMAPFYELLQTLSSWLNSKGINKMDAQKYITSLFIALSEDAKVNAKKDLKILVKNSQTPRGLNEQAVNELRKSGFFKSLNITTNSVLKRLKK